LKQATKIIITAGAGIGVDSGMPNFRGNNGFWNTFVPFKDNFTF
jgi:NAD-dependent SIR2 family protein deacetylase